MTFLYLRPNVLNAEYSLINRSLARSIFVLVDSVTLSRRCSSVESRISPADRDIEGEDDQLTNVTHASLRVGITIALSCDAVSDLSPQFSRALSVSLLTETRVNALSRLLREQTEKSRVCGNMHRDAIDFSQRRAKANDEQRCGAITSAHPR